MNWISSALVPGWYILLYHNVSWEEDAFLQRIGGTCAPDIFRAHVEFCKSEGTIVSVQVGIKKLRDCKIDGPMFSFWFDDGFLGVRKYAAPILADADVAGATSICSRFVLRREFFWRFKLSYLFSIMGAGRLRAALGMGEEHSQVLIRDFTLMEFSPDLLRIIDGLFDRWASHAVQKSAFTIFETEEGLKTLQARGWLLANHSAAHYPLNAKQSCDVMLEAFKECDLFMKGVFGEESEYWVVPFGTGMNRQCLDLIKGMSPRKEVALVGNRVNTPRTAADGVIYRINAPVSNKRQIIDVLRSCS